MVLLLLRVQSKGTGNRNRVGVGSRVVVPARQATQAGGTDSWAPKKFRILSLFGKANQTRGKERNNVFFFTFKYIINESVRSIRGNVKK
jgi:hypothetical protein